MVARVLERMRVKVHYRGVIYKAVDQYVLLISERSGW